MRRDVVGLGLGFLNPVNQVKAAWGVASNPLNPFAQTRAIKNLFTGGGRGPAPQYMPPGAYDPQQQYAPPPPPPGYPPGFAPQAYPSYAPAPMYGGNTGWDASYGDAAPDPSGGADPWAGYAPPSY
jgi:hypothetical protein